VVLVVVDKNGIRCFFFSFWLLLPNNHDNFLVVF